MAALAKDDQLAFGEQVITDQPVVDAVQLFADAQEELAKLENHRATIRALEKQKAEAKERLRELLNLTKPATYRVGCYKVTVALPEQESQVVERVNRPKIKITNDED